MQAGKLNSKITIKRLVKSPDQFGGFRSTLSTVASVWCDLKQINGEINEKFGKRDHEIEVEILMRKKTANLILIGDIFTVEVIEFEKLLCVILFHKLRSSVKSIHVNSLLITFPF